MNKVEIIPLGGIGEFGMNCMGIRFADEMIIVDAGMGFPEETPFGVDISIPNFDFLEEYRDDLTAGPYARPRGPYRCVVLYPKKIQFAGLFLALYVSFGGEAP